MTESVLNWCTSRSCPSTKLNDYNAKSPRKMRSLLVSMVTCWPPTKRCSSCSSGAAILRVNLIQSSTRKNSFSAGKYANALQTFGGSFPVPASSFPLPSPFFFPSLFNPARGLGERIGSPAGPGRTRTPNVFW